MAQDPSPDTRSDQSKLNTDAGSPFSGDSESDLVDSKQLTNSSKRPQPNPAQGDLENVATSDTAAPLTQGLPWDSDDLDSRGISPRGFQESNPAKLPKTA